jgi:hypothetical protein
MEVHVVFKRKISEVQVIRNDDCETVNLMFVDPCIIVQFRHTCVPDNVHQLHVQQPSTYKKPEATSAVLGS